MTKREQEKQRLIAVNQALQEKYPAEVYHTMENEPEDVLQHAREVVRFGAKSAGELYEISFPPFGYGNLPYEASVGGVQADLDPSAPVGQPQNAPKP